MVEREVSRLGVEHDRAEGFRVHDPGDALGIEIGDQRVVEDRGSVEDTGQSRHRAFHVVEQAADRRRIRHVDAGLADHDAVLSQVVEQHLGSIAAGAAAAGEHEVARTTAGEHPHHLDAHAAKGAGHEIGRIGPNRALQRRQRRDHDVGRVVEVDHDLADLLRLGHEPQGLAGLRGREAGQRQGQEVARREALEGLAKETQDDVAARQGETVEVERDEADASVEGRHGETVLLQDVALADLDEPSEGRQRVEAALHGLAGERVQHHVDAAALRGLPHPVDEFEAAGVPHLSNAELEQHGPLLGAAGRGEDRGAQPAGHLDRRHADAAGARVDEHRLAAPQPGRFVERVIGRHERDRDGRGLGRGHGAGSRQGEELVGSDRDVRAETPRHQGDEFVSHREAGHAGPDRRDHGGGFHAERLAAMRADEVLLRQQSQDFEHVLEIQTDGADAKFDLVFGRSPPRQFAVTDLLEVARNGDFKRIGGIVIKVFHGDEVVPAASLGPAPGDGGHGAACL